MVRVLGNTWMPIGVGGNFMPGASQGISTSDATATASDILQDKTAYVNGGKITGTISSYTGSSLIIPGVEDKVLSSAEGIYLPKAVKVAGESNLLAENIKKGVSIFGIVGTLESGGGTPAEYYKCASVDTGGTVTDGKTLTVSGAMWGSYYNGTYTLQDESATGYERVWIHSGGRYALKYYTGISYIGNTNGGWGFFDLTYPNMEPDYLCEYDDANPWEHTIYQNAENGEEDNINIVPSTTAVPGNTWSGYKAVFDSGAGTWSFESGVTSGLTYTSVTPVVSGIYSADALVIVSLLYIGEPTLTSPTGMTSGSSDEWEISASGSYGQHYPWKAFDGQTSLIAPTWTGNSGTSWWLHWQNKQKQVLVQKLRIQGTSSGDIAQQAITSFILHGSDDGISWFDLYTASGLTWSSVGYEWKEFTFSNNKSYYYHRLANITATSFPTIVELETYDM